MKKIFTILVVNLLILTNVYSQDHWRYSARINAGCNLSLYYSKTQRFPGFKFFAGISINSIYRNNFLLNYSASIGCYTKSLGNNLNPLVNDVQFDFTNTFIAGGIWGKDLGYNKYFKTLNNVPFYNMSIQKEFASYIGTMFIFNNHHRNQTVGCIGVNTGLVSANYSNDGGPIMKRGLGDSFDRWWTGHGCIYVHSKQNFNFVELGFDQFTGYSPLLYELSDIIGVNVPDYNNQSDSAAVSNNRNDHRYEYNSSTYSLRINFNPNYGLDLGCIGSLKSNHDTYFAMQDLIHMSAKYPFHPNQDVNRFFIGPNYTYNYEIK